MNTTDTARIVLDMPWDEYAMAPGVSNSMLKDLSVSPLRFWHKHINPEREPEQPSPEMIFGSAFHCAILEPAAFLARYAPEIDIADYPGCLVTIEDVRTWIRDRGQSPKGTRKADVIAQAVSIDPAVPIFEVLERQHFANHNGKILLKKDEWSRIQTAAEAVRSEPYMVELLSRGNPEVCVFAADPETGILLKARLDWMAPTITLDLKTFSQKHGKSIEKSISDAIWYEGYHRQAYFYTTIRRLATGADAGFLFCFVESAQPHDIRLKSLQPRTAGEGNLYWQQAALETRALLGQVAEYRRIFGDGKWHIAAEVDPLEDHDIPQLAW